MAAPAAKRTDIARVGDSLWVTAHNEHRAYGVNLQGDLVVEYQFLPSILCNRVTWDGESLWFACNDTIRQVDPATGEELAVLEADDSSSVMPSDILWDGEVVWLVGREAVHVWDPVARQEMAVFDVDVDLLNIRGTAWDGSALWLLDGGSNLAGYDSTGRRLRRLALSVEGWPIEMTWVGEELWVVDVHGNATRFDNDLAEVGSFSFSQCGYAFGDDVTVYWDGASLWVANTTQNRIIQCAPAD